jgi:hypothetical protein
MMIVAIAVTIPPARKNCLARLREFKKSRADFTGPFQVPRSAYRKTYINDQRINPEDRLEPLTGASGMKPTRGCLTGSLRPMSTTTIPPIMTRMPATSDFIFQLR